MSVPTLFRPEVLAQRKTQWLGPVLVRPKFSHRLFAGVAAAVTTAILALLFMGVYPRKVRVSGLLVPRGGLAQVFSPQAGVVTNVAVEEGQAVSKGDRLVSFSTDRETSFGMTGEQVKQQLTSRKESLLRDRRNIERLSDQQQRSLQDRLDALESSEKKISSEIGLQNARVRWAMRTVGRQKAMEKQGVASTENVQSAEEAQIEQVSRLRELERNRLNTQRDRISIKGDLDDLPIKTQRDVADVDRNVAMVEQQLAELASQREMVMSAPEDGVVTALQAKRGGHPDPRVPLLAIVPKGADLEAQLYCSSRAVGFLKPGQKVLLRYEAFPYQKFGHYEGTVTSVSQSAVSPTELTPEIASLARVAQNEAVYRVTVSLSAQSVQAFGKSVALAPGMQLEADVVLEKRRLVEWMFEPLFTVTGTWKR